MVVSFVIFYKIRKRDSLINRCSIFTIWGRVIDYNQRNWAWSSVNKDKNSWLSQISHVIVTINLESTPWPMGWMNMLVKRHFPLVDFDKTKFSWSSEAVTLKRPSLWRGVDRIIMTGHWYPLKSELNRQPVSKRFSQSVLFPGYFNFAVGSRQDFLKNFTAPMTFFGHD